jgi:far upstream element-binding protein
MQQKTKTRIQIPSQPSLGQAHRIATIIGLQDGCDQVRAMIDRIIHEQSSACVMSGAPYHNQAGEPQYGGMAQQQQHPNSQQYHHQHHHQQYGGKQEADGQLSPEWQAYYAAQALANQPQQGRQEAIATPAAENQSPDAYFEQFFRYSYYYGEDAARQYYGDWSPPIGTPNPYGINPNAIVSAPVDAAVGGSAQVHNTNGQRQQQPPQQQQQQQQQSQQQQQVRDTSVRKVSNLPAWMTKQT